MLKAYDYVEYSPDDSSLQNPQYFEKELGIAQKIVEQIDKKKKEEACCLACHSKKVTSFCKKWDVEYLYCEECETVFASVCDEELEQYKQYEELKQFRSSEEYQQEAAKRREITWMESVDWITFRTFRYLGKNTGLDVLDIGNRYMEYAKAIMGLPLTGNYCLEESILDTGCLAKGKVEKADIVLYLNQIQQSMQPLEHLKEIHEKMKPEGLLFFSTRMGTGFDVLTLKEHSKVFPYEHIFLPSRKGMEMLLNQAGFTILEYATPGRMDVGTVARQIDKIGRENYFIRSLIKNGDKSSLAEFQRFLQKSGMSSYAQIVARKAKK